MIRCIACNDKFDNVQALAIHKRLHCKVWPAYLEQIKKDPEIRRSIQQKGLSATSAMVQITTDKLAELFPDVPRRKRGPNVKKPATPVTATEQPPRDPTVDEIIRALNQMSGEYLRMKDELVKKDEKIACKERQLDVMGAQVIELRTSLNKVMKEHTATIALQLRDRDYDNSINAKQLSGR